MNTQEFSLNVPSNLPSHQWAQIAIAYSTLDGWLGYGDQERGEIGLPHWFSFDTNEKHICVSLEPVGLHFFGKSTDEDWTLWKYKTKIIISHYIGLIVGEVSWGEVRYEAEPVY